MSNEKQRKKDLFAELLKDDGITTLNTDFASEKKEEQAIINENKPKQYCKNCRGSGKCPVCAGKVTEDCRTCHGSGRVGAGHEHTTYGADRIYYHKASGFGGTCPVCGGTGIRHEGILYKEVVCKYCNGEGTCSRCKGTGFEP